MKICSVFSKYFPSCMRRIKLQDKIQNFDKLVVDTFIKSADNFVPFNKMLPRKLSKKWFSKLSAENITKYNNELTSYLSLISLGEINYFTTYAKYLEEGLKKISGDKPLKFVSIGQSPALFAKILELKGIDTAICPISELGRLGDDLSIKNIAQNADFYFNYLKNFNLDLAKLDGNKNYYFSDFCVSGASLKNFKKLLEFRGIKGDNLHFISLDNIIQNALILEKDKPIILDVNNYYLYMQNLKNRYSPIFKLPISKLDMIEDFEKMNIGSSNNISCNLLLYWLLKNKKI